MISVDNIADKILEINNRSKSIISLVPSENILSPLARVPYLLDVQARYYLDDLRLFGERCFPSGIDVEEIENDILIPTLSTLSKAKYISIRPISGLNAMTIGISALTSPGDRVLSVPMNYGGHASTSYVIKCLGLKYTALEFCNVDTLDLEKLESCLKEFKPRLIYIDQSTFLVPLDPLPIREIVDRVSPGTMIFFDTSHTNGLILGESLPNPLDRGADIFGGSTHKTMPGPQKGFLATNQEKLFEKIQLEADHLVSHHHSASVLSLAITVDEFINCKGKEYCQQLVKNSKKLYENLQCEVFNVQHPVYNMNPCHQIWFQGRNISNSTIFTNLNKVGIKVNKVKTFPGNFGGGFRISVAEFTRLGAKNKDIEQLSSILKSAVISSSCFDVEDCSDKVKYLKRQVSKPKYCYDVPSDFYSRLELL
ncbi:PLP-dependent transferase [Photorhabdus tasmaniensis]|uniref:Serine hydroxymethyltransferase-like domain-containing protein n=1 Tax=Photorhabdus tasmaniensis TaxID=1004159 RepID=A0ABX0GLR4_9GAMM|nr:PLP-dependent transferase [Photorhabdus tasmaniensis]NHB89166.1 hypothetical protein [Photorhabdus tasmaniensis]